MRVLVTGARGFVGQYLTAALRERGHVVVEADRIPHHDALPIDVTDPLAVQAAFDLAQPDAVAHLAAQAFAVRLVGGPPRDLRSQRARNAARARRGARRRRSVHARAC